MVGLLSLHKCYLVAAFLIASSVAIPTQGLGNKSNIQTSGSISYPAGFFYGVCAHPWALIERDFQEMKTLGVKYVRMDFSWQDFEKTRDALFDYSKYDKFVNWSKTYGIEIIPVLMRVPTWIGTGGDTNIPVYGSVFDDFVTKFGQFTYKVVDHFKGSITYFEIWNEPDVPGFWNDSDGTRYHDFIHGEATRKFTILLNEAYTQAKAANPNCKIISGGIANDVYYLQDMYAYGAKFDLLGAHPYFTNSPTKNYDVDYINPLGHEYHFPKIQYLRDIMVAKGDGAKKIMITEVGVDGQFPLPIPANETQQSIQADRLTRVFQKTLQEYPYVQGIMWYQLKDTHKAFSSVPVTIANWGLFRMNGTWDPEYPNVTNYTPRLMYYAYKQVIAASST